LEKVLKCYLTGKSENYKTVRKPHRLRQTINQQEGVLYEHRQSDFQGNHPLKTRRYRSAIKVLEEKLMPYLIALTPSQRLELPKMSDKTLPFVEKIKEYFVTAPEFIPAFTIPPSSAKTLTSTPC
jgi:hypothetical protein